MPRLMNIGPPGSAKALISFTFTGVNGYWNAGLFNSGGAAVDQPLAERVEVSCRSRRRCDDRIRLADLGRGLLADLHVLLGRVLVLRRRDLRLREDLRGESVAATPPAMTRWMKPAERTV